MLINNNVEVSKKKVRNFQRLPSVHYQIGLPLPAPIATMISLINYSYVLVKDLRTLCKKQKKKKKREKKLNLKKSKNNGAPKYHILFRKKMILLNETLKKKQKIVWKKEKK